MIEDLIKITTKNINLLSCKDWLDQGIVHGFSGIDFDVHKRVFNETLLSFKKKFGVNDLILPSQTHSNIFLDYRMNKKFDCMEGDAILFNLENSNIAYGIRTADCVPIIIREKNSFALIHSGWRGLSNNIIEKTIKALGGASEVLIGPAADENHYEVGEDVISAIGKLAEFKNKGESKYLLNVTKTAGNQILDAYSSAKIHVSEYRTISSDLYFSHRRSGDSAGRNLTFIIDKIN